MKTINMLGVDYTEDKIQVLIKYLHYMDQAMKPMSHDSLIEYIAQEQRITKDYINNQSEEDKALLIHFAESSRLLNHKLPGTSLITDGLFIMYYSTVAYMVPSALNLGICAVLAAFVTKNIKQMSDKNAYNQIMREIKIRYSNKEE